MFTIPVDLCEHKRVCDSVSPIRIPDRPGLGIELNLPAFAGKPLKSWRRQLVIESDGNIGYQ